MAQLRAIDLFCGCGGLTLGLKQANFSVVGAIEIDSLCVETYIANHPEVHVYTSDIQTLNPAKVMKELGLKKGDLDLLAGCPPCQGFSSMTTRNGRWTIDDSRNDLIFEFHRFVKALMPRSIMMENVPGLQSDERFRRLINRLKKLGYKISIDARDAADYGVPQRRRRLIVLGSLKATPKFAKRCSKRVTVRDAIASLPTAGSSGDPAHDLKENRTSRIKNLIARIPKDGGSRNDLPKSEQLQCHQSCDGFKDVYGRMAWDKVAPTITGGCFNPSKGRFLHPEENRAITMREAALLQGFPKDYQFPRCSNKSALALMIGNALPPAFIHAHASGIKR